MRKDKRQYVYWEWSKDGLRELKSEPSSSVGHVLLLILWAVVRIIWALFLLALRIVWRLLIIVALIGLYVLAIAGAFTEASRIAQESMKRNL